MPINDKIHYKTIKTSNKWQRIDFIVGLVWKGWSQMNIRNEDKIVGAFQNLILSIASVFYIYAIAMLLELIHKFF